MDKRKRVRLILTLSIMFVMLFSITAFADDAVIDILDKPRFQGAVNVVEHIGRWVDSWFAAVITFVAFFIISASCLRNVLAGAYCVFPKFWDKVDEAHKAMESISIASIQGAFAGGAWKNTVSTGSFTQFVLRCLPNIKVLTDFEEAQDVDYKQYFMRAIPQCVLAVFVGVFIYNGYYRDVMKVTSSFGSEVVTQAINSIDPHDILYKLTNISGIPPYPVKGAKDGVEHVADNLVTNMYKHVLGQYPDQAEKAHKTDCFQSLSKWALAQANAKYSAYSDAEVWDMQVLTTGYDTSEPSMPADKTSEDGMEVTSSVVMNCTTDLSLNTTYNQDKTIYVYATIRFKNKGAKDNSIKAGTADDLVLHLVSTDLKNGVVTYTYNQGSVANGQLATNSGAKIGDWDVRIGGTTISFDKNPNGIEMGKMYRTTNFEYVQGQRYKIQGVIFESSGVPTLSSSNLGISVAVGDSIEDAYNAKKRSSGGSVETSASNKEETTQDVSSLEEGAN